MRVKIPQYLVVCVPERTSVRDLVEYQTNRLATQESPHLIWGGGYLYEYVEEWSDKEPYTHYIARALIQIALQETVVRPLVR